MTAGEIRRPEFGPTSESANASIHRTRAALSGAAAGISLRDAEAGGPLTDVAALLAEDADVSPRTRQAVEALLQRHRMLAGELARQRTLLQEWILSQLTYKALYFQYSGQTPEAPSVELMREKDMVRRRIREQLHAGRDYASVLEEQSRSLSKP
ncbi:hypothetical protein [Cupriavidus campinensis]